MRIGRVFAGIVCGVGLACGVVKADGPPRFGVPKTKHEWAGRRESLRSSILETLGDFPSRLARDGDGTHQIETIEGIVIDRFTRFDGSGHHLNGMFVRPQNSVGRLPTILFLADGKNAATRPGLDGLPAAIEIAKRGMAIYWIEVEAMPDPWREPTRWPQIVANDQLVLADVLRRTDVDPDKIGILGIGLGGTRAVWLMALNDRIKVCVAIGGLTRFADLMAIRRDKMALPSWMSAIMDGKDTEALVALCAGRSLEWTVGEQDPSSPISGVNVVDSVGKAMANLVGGGHGFHITRLGRQDDHYGRLQWMGALEIFDKAFFPQTAGRLGHPPEPEPDVTSDFIDLAPHGLAGWVSEMSQRPTTWTWVDGVIGCNPGRDEYGWLRAPIEVKDFILTAEWKVPPGGNSGIFLRAKPVPWNFPPSQTYKRVVSTLGLDWPSRTGLELQAQDDHGQADKYTSGSLYRHAAAAENPTHPAGEWNKFTVRCQGMRVEVWTNGKQVLDTLIDQCPLTLSQPPARGYIGLQNHGSPGEFRNIKLRRL